MVKSLFVHPALFGYFTAFVSLLLLARYVVTRQLRWLLLSVFAAIGPFLSARRRAILALAAGALAAAVASRSMFESWRAYWRTWIPAAISGAVLFLVFLSLLTGLYDAFLGQLSGRAPCPPCHPVRRRSRNRSARARTSAPGSRSTAARSRSPSTSSRWVAAWAAGAAG